MGMTGFGEVLPYDNGNKLDPDKKDKWGLPCFLSTRSSEKMRRNACRYRQGAVDMLSLGFLGISG